MDVDVTARQGSPEHWTIGQLAHASGLSVRVLRHWEQVGVLTAHRDSSGHRRYGTDHVTRLYQALALRRAGLGLAHIGALLDSSDPDPQATLQAHLDELDASLRRQGQLRDRLAEALADSQPDVPTLMRVIESMTMFEQYVHGYADEESRRLQDQAGTLEELLHGDFAAAPGERVLEVGCGVGAQTLALLRRAPGAEFVCVDVSPESLAQAAAGVADTGIANVTHHQVDVFDLPSDGALAAYSFDHVVVCFLLEHLADPAAALTNLRSMLRPGGTLTVIEGDHGSTYFHPDSAPARAAIDCQVTLQRHAGGDAMIGRRLHPLLMEAGYAEARVSPRQVYVDRTRPDLVDGFIRRTFTAMVEGVRYPALAAGLIDADTFDRGIDDLLRTAESDGVFCYTFFKATARP